MDISKMFEEWKDSFLNPGKKMPSLVEKADLSQGLQHLIIGYVISGIIGIILAVLLSVSAGPLGMLFGGVGIFGQILGIIFGIIFYLIGAAIIWIIAKVLGGMGTYGQQVHMTAAPFAFLLVINSILSIVPFLGAFLSFLLSLYYLYLMTIAIKEAHKFSTLRAVASWLLPIIIVGLLVLVMGAAILGSLGLGALAMAKTY